MKTKIIAFLILLFVAFGLGYFWVAPHLSQNQLPTADENEPLSPEQTHNSSIEELISGMSIEEKIAQMLIVQPTSRSISDAMAERLASAPYGGFILLGDNMGSLSSTRDFIRQLQDKSKTPLIIATDQEGGLVQRLRSVSGTTATYVPEMYRLGQTNNPALAKEVGRVMAEEMRVLGINVDFAPVADVYSNPNNTVIGTRSFSMDPSIVSSMSIALADGLQNNGITACYKHFPGHGDTATDSHLSLPIINRTREQLDAVDLLPFKNAISENARMIMLGHIAMPALTGDNTPASMSKTIATDLLRGEFGFDGLIVTDGLNMGALLKNYSEEEIYYRAVEAGADLLVLPLNPELAIQSIKEHISEDRINESLIRIMQFKQDYLANYTYLDESYFGSKEHAEVIRQIP